MRNWLAVLIMVFLLNSSTAARADELCVAFWNVENLFDTVDDSATEKDEEFTPGAPKKWTDERFQAKLKNLARVISDMNGGHGPDVLGLAEVENRFVIEKLVEELSVLKRDYGIVHQDSPSFRGIDCAAIYDKKKLKLAGNRLHHVEGVRATRDIVEAEFTAGNHTLYVFVNHWPSRGGDKEGVGRIQAAKTLRKRVDEIMQADPAADFAIVGDLNDHPTNRSVSKVLRTWGDPDKLKPGVLFNSTWPVHVDPKRGTSNYRGQWQVIDHVILSPGLLDERGFRWKRGSTTEVRFPYQIHARGTPKARPNRTYGGDKYYGGYSDHLPVLCIVEH